MAKNKMHILLTSLALILSTVSSIPTIRSSSKCSVHPCAHSSLLSCTSTEDVCFNFQTLSGTNFCAPASSCELLDPCDHNGYCSSNTSVCIGNSCCIQPVCLPLILADLCSANSVTKEQMNVYTTASRLSTTSVRTSTEIWKPIITDSKPIIDSPTTESLFQQMTSSETYSSNEFKYEQKILKKFETSSSIFNPKICPKAYWNTIGKTVASFSDITPKDFFINQYEEIYIPDNKNHIIRKYFLGNDSTWITAVESNLFNDPTAIFVDLNDNIYIWDSKNYRIYLWSSVTNVTQTILSFNECKESANSNKICFGKSLFVDSNNSIYISESTKEYPYANRVMKFEDNSTVGRVIGGTSTYGSGMKQLNSPRTIFVDSNEILYVADIDNSRIQRFIPGNRNGTTVMSMDGLTDFIMDHDGNFFVLIKSENIVKKIEKNSMNSTSENVIEFLNQPTKLHFGIDGSIYVLNEGIANIQKFQIMNNIC